MQQKVTLNSRRQFPIFKTFFLCLMTTINMNWVNIGKNFKKKDLILLFNTTKQSKVFLCITIHLTKISSESLYKFQNSSKSFATSKLTKLQISDTLTLKEMLFNFIKLDFWNNCRIWTFFMTILLTIMKILTSINNLLLKIKLNNSDKNISPNKRYQLMKISKLRI